MILNKFYGALLVSVTPEKRNVCVPADPCQARCCIASLGGFLCSLYTAFPPCIGRQMASLLDPQLVNDLIITVSTRKSKYKENDWERRGKKQTNLGSWNCLRQNTAFSRSWGVTEACIWVRSCIPVCSDRASCSRTASRELLGWRSLCVLFPKLPLKSLYNYTFSTNFYNL